MTNYEDMERQWDELENTRAVTMTDSCSTLLTDEERRERRLDVIVGVMSFVILSIVSFILISSH